MTEPEVSNTVSDTPRRVLVMRFSALGDVAMTVPPVIDAALSNPDTQFFMLTRPLPAHTFGPKESLPANLHVSGVDLRAYKGLSGLWRLSGELMREVKPDLTVDLHDVIRSRLLALMLRLRAGVRGVCIDKGRRQKKALTRRHNKRKIFLPTGDRRYRDTFSRAGLQTTPQFAGHFPEERQSRTSATARTPRIAIAPFAAHAGKEWPLPAVEKVIAALSQLPGAEMLLFGSGEREQAIIRRWAAAWPATVTDMTEKRLPLEEEMREMAQCDVMLSMDSANMHLASLAGVPVVSVWGATDIRAGFLGWRQNPADAISLDMECRPCSVFGNKPCHLTRDGSRPCLERLEAEAVINALKRHLPSP